MYLLEKQLVALDVAISTSSFGLSYSDVQDLQHSIVMVKNCKPTFFGGFLQVMFFQWILNLLFEASDFCGLQSLVW